MRTGSRALPLVVLFLLLKGATSVCAGDFASALSALDQFSSTKTNSEKQGIIGMVGFYGQPEPPQWLILQNDKSDPNLLQESVVSRGKVAAERKFKRLPNQDLPSIPLIRKRLKIDSGKAFSIAEEVARKNKINFDSAHFQLRCRDQKQEPVWMLSLINRLQVAVGAIYISAESGKVLRVQMSGSKVEKYSSPIETKGP